MPDLTGRTAIVTGASRGIGRGIAEVLIAQGAKVVITGRGREDLDRAAQELGPDRVLGVVGDATDSTDISGTVEAALSWEGRVDFLVNNAGYLPTGEDLSDAQTESLSRVFQANVGGAVAWTAAVWDAYMRSHGGAVVNVASVAAHRVALKTGGYSASKAALVTATRQLALELAPDVRVNAISPGFTVTATTSEIAQQRGDEIVGAYPLGRLGRPTDIGRAACFLLSDDASWITGQELVVDGGFTLRRP